MFSEEEIEAILEVERADRIAQAQRDFTLQAKIEAERLALMERRRIAAAGCDTAAEFENLQARPGFGIF